MALAPPRLSLRAPPRRSRRAPARSETADVGGLLLPDINAGKIPNPKLRIPDTRSHLYDLACSS